MKRLAIYRKNSVVTLVVILMISATSCVEFLDKKPTDGLVRSDYWNNKEEVLSTLAGAYKKLAALDNDLFIHGEIRGDMVDAGPSLPGNQKNIVQGNIQSNNTFANWAGFYSVINLCNHIIKIAPSVQEVDQTFSDYLLQQYTSEAVFLRSLCYFYLVRIFNDVPFVLDPSETDNADFFLPLTPAEEILTAIKADLIGIQKQIPTEYPTDEYSKSRATTGAVNALLADISLWNFNYADCIKYVTAVEESGYYFLLPATEWFEIFQPGFSLEGIFEIYYDQVNSQGNSLYRNTYELNYYVASEYARRILDIEVFGAAEQIRGYGSLSKQNKIWKYAGQFPDQKSVRPSGEQASANFIVYRLADLYLMKAEALSQSGNYNQALEYLNMIRDRANMETLSLSDNPQLFEDAILEERAKELAFEGKRWFDLLRMGRRNNYANKDKLIQILVQNVPSTQKLVLQAKLSDSMGWFMPIYINEINRNRKIIQNPYYYEEE